MKAAWYTKGNLIGHGIIVTLVSSWCFYGPDEKQQRGRTLTQKDDCDFIGQMKAANTARRADVQLYLHDSSVWMTCSALSNSWWWGWNSSYTSPLPACLPEAFSQARNTLDHSWLVIWTFRTTREPTLLAMGLIGCILALNASWVGEHNSALRSPTQQALRNKKATRWIRPMLGRHLEPVECQRCGILTRM